MTSRSIPGRRWRPRFSLRAALVAAAASGAVAAFVALFLSPILGASPDRQTPGQAGLTVLFGLVLPALWIGAWRRFTVERLLAQIAVIAGLAALVLGASQPGRPSPDLVMGVLAVAVVVVPSFAWYAVSRMEPGEDRDRARQVLRTYMVNVTLAVAELLALFGVAGLALG